MKRFTASLFITAIVLQNALTAFAGSLLTNSSEFTKVATYGMNFATYTAEKKNGKEAAEKLLGYDVLWDVMGKGEEFLINGDPDAFPKFKDDVLKVKLVLDKVAEIASKLGSGEYDDAAIAGVDTAIGLINHPVVNALWEAVKLTYESHKLVQSSKAALDIETLYGIVNKDRRLVGTNNGDAPDLIPVNSETTTYFFNKYLIVNASTRALVKTYVKNKLGEDFPEISTSSKIWAAVTFTSDAEKAEHELQELKEFENNSRRWIKELIEDLNKQVRLQWAQTRAYQKREQFKVFYAKIGKTFKNLDAAMAYFANMNRIKKEKDKFPEYLTKFKTQTTKLTTNYQQLKPAQIKGKLSIRKQLFSIAEQCHKYSVRSLIINDFTMQDNFEKLQTMCLTFINEIDKETRSSEDEMISELSAPETKIYGWRKSYDVDPKRVQYEQFMLSYFSNVIPEYRGALAGIPKAPFNEIKTALSDNDIQEATRILDKWQAQTNNFFNQAGMAAQKELFAAETIKPSPDSAKRIVPKNTSWDYRGYEGTLVYARDKYWKKARDKTNASLGAVASVRNLKYSDDLTTANAMLDIYSHKKAQVGATVEGNISQLRRIQESAWKIYIHSYLKNYNKYLTENTYIAIGKIYEPSRIGLQSVGYLIRGKKNVIQTPLYQLEKRINALNVVDAQVYAAQEVKKTWAEFPRLEAQTIELYNDFGYQKLDYNAELNSVKKQLNGIRPESIKSAANSFIQLAQTNINNRSKDIEYLELMERQWNAWFEKQKQEETIYLDNRSGTYVFGFKKDHDTGYAIVNEPFSHFATQKDFSTNQKLVRAKTDLENLRVYTLINTSMPNLKQFLDAQFNGANYTIAKEENFIIGSTPVWESDIKNTEKLLAGMSAEDLDFTKKLKEIALLFPSILSFPEKTESDKKKSNYELEWQNTMGVWKKLYTDDFKDFELGQRFIKLRKKIQEIRLKKSHLFQKERSDKFQAEESKKRLAEYKKEFETIKSEVNSVYHSTEIKKQTIDTLYQKYWDLRTKYFNDKIAEDSGFSSSLKSYDTNFADLFRKYEGIEEEIIQKIKTLYADFKAAYEQMDEYQLVDFLSQNWDSGDETTLTDLEDNFRNMFSVYDSIEYSISNLNVSKKSKDVFVASYEVTISGQNFDMDITRIEKSSVSEEIIFENDIPKINRTLSGRFWYRQ